MNSKILPILSLLLMIIGFVAPTPQAQANAADVKIRLVASPDFAGAKGAAKYRDRGGEQEFQVEVEVSRRLAGAVFTVVVDDVVVGEMIINAFGKGRLSLNSDLGQIVPEIVRGSVVQVVNVNDLTVVSGAF